MMYPGIDMAVLISNLADTKRGSGFRKLCCYVNSEMLSINVKS